MRTAIGRNDEALDSGVAIERPKNVQLTEWGSQRTHDGQRQGT